MPLTIILPLQDQVMRVFQDCESGRVSNSEGMRQTIQLVMQASVFDAFKDGFRAAGLAS